MDITAAVTHGLGDDFKLESVQLAEPEFDEVRVRIVATGVCHTDVVARDLGIAPFPIVLGHEGAGVIEAIGKGVSDLEVGDHVVFAETLARGGDNNNLPVRVGFDDVADLAVLAGIRHGAAAKFYYFHVFSSLAW